MAEFGFEQLARSGPSPFAYEPGDVAQNLNRSDVVLRCSDMCVVLGGEKERFFERLDAYEFPEGMNINNDERKGYYFHAGARRLVSIHSQLRPNPTTSNDIYWTLKYLFSCKEQECLPSPEMCLQVLMRPLLMSMMQLYSFYCRNSISSMPYSYYAAI
jgi:hypothetical protein